MKVQIIGFERSKGVSMKNPSQPKPYDVASLHAVIRLDDSGNARADSNASGYMGTSYRVNSEMVMMIEELPLPFNAELFLEDVMRYGKRETIVVGIKPDSSSVQIKPVAAARAA